MQTTSPPTDSDSKPFQCNPNYNSYLESLKYVGCLIYLLPGLTLHLLILKTMFRSENQIFRESSFFQIYATDSIASAYLLFWNILFDRLFLFVPPLCPIVGPFFWNPSVFLKLYYCSTAHARFTKSVVQVFMVVNRMSCVLMPADYVQIWRKLTPITICLIIIIPFGAIWNVILSRPYLSPSYGGFGVDYIKAVEWASASMFQSIYIITALIATVTCTSVTLYQLISLPDRIKSAEKSLCFTSIAISTAFLILAATQVTYLFCTSCRRSLFVIQFLAFDILNVGSAVIMIITNVQLREEMFYKRRRDSDRMFQVSINNSSSRLQNNRGT